MHDNYKLKYLTVLQDINGSLHCAVPVKSIPTPWKVIRNSLGEGALKSQNFLEAKYEAKLESPFGDGKSKPKKLFVGEYGYFSGTAH